MRIVDSASYRIEGNFIGQVDWARPSFFQGKILGGPMGRFTGIMVDEYGVSHIRGNLIGNISHDCLKFEKKYDQNHRLFRRGSRQPIDYEVIHNNSGGWDGTWRIRSGEECDCGYVTIAIVPWCNTYRINPELRKLV